MLGQERGLREREGEIDRGEAPDLQIDPGLFTRARRAGGGQVAVAREPAPGDLVGDGERREEYRVTQRQRPPCVIGKMQRAVEQGFEEIAAAHPPADQHQAEQRVDDRRLHVEKRLVVKDERQPAKDADGKTGDEQHRRDPPLLPDAVKERDRESRQEQLHGEKQFLARGDRPSKDGRKAPAEKIGDEKDRERPEIDKGLGAAGKAGSGHGRGCSSQVGGFELGKAPTTYPLAPTTSQARRARAQSFAPRRAANRRSLRRRR